jgi:hypothetical protein
MNRCHRFFCASIVGCSIFTLAQADSPAAHTYIDALIPMVALAVEKPPPAVNIDEKGIIWNGVLLATQPVRPIDAILMEETVNKVIVKRPLLLTLLGRIDLDDHGKPPVWCKDTVNPNGSIDCYEDSDGDGTLDKRARGYLPRLEALSVNRIGPFEAIDPVAYRKAEPAELPLFAIDYLLCRPAGPTIRFSRRVKKDGPLTGSAAGPCDSVASPAADQTDGASVYVLDQIKIKVRAADGARMAVMTEGMPPGYVIGHLRTDRPISDIAHTRRFSEEHEAALAELPDVYMSTAPTIAKEPVKIGQTFFSAEVKHSITGTLHAAAIQFKFFKGKPNELIPAGARLFGVQMQNSAQSANLDANIVWCYPDPLGARTSGAKCIVNVGSNASLVLDVRQRFHLSNLIFGSGAPSIELPLIERGTVDFGEPIVLEIATAKIGKKVIDIRATLDRASERNKSLQNLEIERATDGNGYLLIGSGTLVLEPLDDGTIRIAEDIPVTAGGDVEIHDVIKMKRELRRGR